MEIYELALKRYKGDIDLWFRYLEFCRIRKNGRMKTVLYYSIILRIILPDGILVVFFFVFSFKIMGRGTFLKKINKFRRNNLRKIEKINYI